MYIQCARRITRTPLHHTRWIRTPIRCYASAGESNPEWFQQLRREMMSRDTLSLREIISSATDEKLVDTLESFLPPEWCPRHYLSRPDLAIGHHLVYFNPSMPADKLLPDGTDPLQDPGEPWVRRMWAGGSIQLKPHAYHHRTEGFILNSSAVCAERIRDVQLRGHGDAAKIFVTIERRFARNDKIRDSYTKARSLKKKHGGETDPNPLAYFRDQQHDGEEWGDALFKEVRNLVFLRARTAAETDAIQAGHMAPVKYLTPPDKPDFSHTLTPTRSMLFRFSALTWNAHLIHLDPEYARNVEGHRNMLVHGPLTLTLMLQAINSYIGTHTKKKQYFASIEYRNLAPLYCDEEMRICGMVTKTSDTGNQYDVWIEGPTGGMAVKGTVTSVSIPRPAPPRSERRFEKMMLEEKAGGHKFMKTFTPISSVRSFSSMSGLNMARVRKNKQIEPPLTIARPKFTQPFTHGQKDDTNTPPHPIVLTRPKLPQPSPHYQNAGKNALEDTQSQSSPDLGPATRLRQPTIAIPRRVTAPPSPMRPTMTSRNREILLRLARQKPVPIKPVSPIRKYGATPWEDAQPKIEPLFERRGVKKVTITHIKRQGAGIFKQLEWTRGRDFMWRGGITMKAGVVNYHKAGEKLRFERQTKFLAKFDNELDINRNEEDEPSRRNRDTRRKKKSSRKDTRRESGPPIVDSQGNTW